MTFEQELELAVRKLYGISKEFGRERQRILALGGAYASSSAEAAAPKSKAPHKRYSTPKLIRKVRAPKGMGVVAATYMPGNLARSINVLKFSRAKSKVFVGAKLARNSKGIFSGRRVDGYYMHFTEEGTPRQAGRHWFRSSWERSKGRVFGIIKTEFERVAKEYEIKNAIR